MKKTFSLVAAFTLAMSTAFYSPVVPVLAKDKAEKLKIESKGHSRTILIETTDYDASTNEESIMETHGEELAGKFNVDSESFRASIKNEETKETFNLEGKIEKILEENKAYYFTGVDENNELIKFEAIVEDTGKNYEATINIFEYNKKNDKEPTSSKTYIFDGEGKKTKKYKEKVDRNTIKMKKVKDKDGKQKLTALYEDDEYDYYRGIQAGTGTGWRYRIQGPLTTETDAGNNYSFRWGTDIEDIEEELEEDGLDYTGNHDIVNFRLRIQSDEDMVFNTVDPINNSEEEFSVPMWFGTQIGVVNIPVEASSISITGNGTDNLLYDFKWNTSYYPSGYLDERPFSENPGNKPGFAVRYFMDTAPSIDTGNVDVDFSGYFKYRSLVNKYTLLLHEYTEVTKKSNYTIEIVD
ncbi:hypothetical protein [Brevibacillus migulae]|uniref:hypothetical protein n=1 Tax=Brevibacillus migulae TaxID=1644114 RepID=UPI001F41737F|nr:hypothetical protein [Brevibacillus migulae]